jgi:hypothetical protein
LNSSLFEQSELERHTIRINQLKNNLTLPVYKTTVLKDPASGARISGRKNTLHYLFEFLDAFDFASETSAQIQEENKTLINASVLGLIFEKINGYKDGSFFTPGFITMYMCHETIRRAVIQKFNERYGWECKDFDDLYNKTDKIDLRETNEVINSLKICDPAVGSGHFLVSALNEIIAIKSDLVVLADRTGKRLKGYYAQVENDELIISSEDVIYEYNYRDRESQRVQEAIFHEKQYLIENCLFGVDINQKSVEICRLRLWIELLKSAYYLSSSHSASKTEVELQTLPNIDINIKCGNSLISRFDIADNYKDLPPGVQQKMRLATRKYKDQVILYKCTTDKAVRHMAEKEIARLKEQFASIANPNDKDYQVLSRKKAELHTLTMEIPFDDREVWGQKLEKLTQEVSELEEKYREKQHTLYGNAFEWRFEFPEVLDEDGNFVGFDVVIGNPPYGYIFSQIEKQLYLIEVSQVKKS